MQAAGAPDDHAVSCPRSVAEPAAAQSQCARPGALASQARPFIAGATCAPAAANHGLGRWRRGAGPRPPTSLAAADTGANRLMNGAECELFLAVQRARGSSLEFASTWIAAPAGGTLSPGAIAPSPRPTVYLGTCVPDLRHHPILMSHDRWAGDSPLQGPARP